MVIQTMNKTIQAAIFDLDGVLVDSEWVAFQAWRDYVEARGGRLDETLYPTMVGISAEETALVVMQHSGLTFDVAESVDWIWTQMGLRLRRKIEPLPGAVDLVRGLKARQLPLAIASNGLTDYIANALTGLGLLEYFPVRASIDQVAEGKPAPDVYLRAAERLGIAPENCLAFEDSRVGVQAADSAGMRVIAIPGRHDHKHGFQRAWRMYDSLVSVNDELDEILG